MARPATVRRRYEVDVQDQDQLMMATQAYFEALPLLHKELIVELSAQREEGPVALLGKAIADGLERFVLEVATARGGS